MDSAVLGSYFLQEYLGVLGKIGCAICLIGSVIIVLHAPPDEEVESVDKILNYAIQPGMTWLLCVYMAQKLTGERRFPHLLCLRCRLLHLHDLQHCAQIRQTKPARLPVYLLDNRLCIYHGDQGIWHCAQDDIRRQQPVFTPFYLCLRNHNGCLHFDTDELLQ